MIPGQPVAVLDSVKFVEFIQRGGENVYFERIAKIVMEGVFFAMM